MEERTMGTIANSHELATWLVSLVNIKRVDVARATKNNPANLSQWLMGREKLLSARRKESVLEWLGLSNGKLVSGSVHRWVVGNDFSALRALLLATETSKTLSSVRVHKVDSDQSHDAQSPILLEFERAGTPIVMLVGRTNAVGKHPLPLDVSSLGFGRMGSDVCIPAVLLNGANLELPTTEFFKHLRGYESSINSTSVGPKGSHQQDNFAPDQLVLEMQKAVDAYRSDVAELRAHEAGLRAVIRAILGELRQINPHHPLLEEKIRKEIYEEYYQAEAKKHQN